MKFIFHSYVYIYSIYMETTNQVGMKNGEATGDHGWFSATEI